MKTERVVWPAGKACCAMISVNLDAEYFGRIFYSEISPTEGNLMRMGQNGIQYGLPRLLDTLDRYGVKATFFIPGAVAEKYPSAVYSIADKGHEIGVHGYAHENFANLSLQEQREVLQKSIDCLAGRTGQSPVGFRMPEGEMTEDTLAAARAMGFRYSSSLSDDDVPYMRSPSGIVELPIHWELFDLPYFVFSFDPPIPPGQARSVGMDEVLQNWLYELEGARHFNTFLNLQLDPQSIGEQGRIFILEQFLETMQRAGDVWIATGAEIADYLLRQGGV